VEERERRCFKWLDQAERGWPIARIARLACVSEAAVKMALARARLARDARNGLPLIWVPDLELFFPINGLFPSSRCHCTPSNHDEGSVRTCAVCHRCGIDGHPGLQRHPATDPPRERKPPPIVTKAPHAITRKERRRAAADQAIRVA
jgi:hypothetical protein